MPEQIWGVFASPGGNVAMFVSYNRGSRFGVIGFNDDGQEVRRIEFANMGRAAGSSAGSTSSSE